MISMALVLTCFTAPGAAFSQAAAAAYQGSLPFTIGAGVSNLDVDWGHNRMYGIAAWAQWHPKFLSPAFNGFGLDAEGRDVNYGRGSTLPSNFRMDTFGGGPMYTWRHFRNFQPYGKGLIAIGSIDFRLHLHSNYTHDTRNVYISGGGFNYRIYHHLWLRADYEYQMWPNFLARTLDPQGFTLGASYDFRSLRSFH